MSDTEARIDALEAAVPSAMGDNVVEALKLWAWLLAGLAVLVASILCAVLLSANYTSIAAQLVGSVLTFLGLLFAYLRARHRGNTVKEQVREFVRRLCGKQRNPVHIAAAGAIVRIRGSGYVEVGLTNRPELEVQEQIDLLADYIRDRVMGNFKQIFPRLGEVEGSLKDLRQDIDQKSTETYNRVTADLMKQRREMDQNATLDLRWAIFGVYIATIGIALSFWA